MFEGDYKLVFHLAPPLLAKPDPRTGEPAKMTLRPVDDERVRLLAKFKGLRGTALDIFGRTEERRMERALIEEYEQTVGTLLAGLTRENHALAVEIASLPETIRGYGHIKAKSVGGRAQEARRAARALPRRAGPRRGVRRRAPGQVFLAGMLLALAAHAQTEEIRTLAREDGTSVTYTLRTYPPDAHLLRPDTKPVPTSALDSAKLHLSAPVRRRHRAGRAAVQFAAPALRGAARLPRTTSATTSSSASSRSTSPRRTACSPRSRSTTAACSIWDLREGAKRIAGQYFVEVDGAYLIDDVPNEQRTRLRWVLEAYRTGKIPLKPSP